MKIFDATPFHVPATAARQGQSAPACIPMSDVPAAAAAAGAAMFGVEATGKHHVQHKCICLLDW